MGSAIKKENRQVKEGSEHLSGKLHRLILGDETPDQYTLFTFYINLFFWFCFFIWSLASWLTLYYRKLISDQKDIAVEDIIDSRGTALGFEPGEFISRLETALLLDLLIFSFVFIGLILIYRKKLNFIYFVVGGILLHIGLQLFYIGFNYFSEDVTLFDKTGLLAMLASSIMYYFLLKREKSGGSISFFDEEEAVE